MDRFFQVEVKRGFSSAGFYVGIFLTALAALSGIGELAEAARRIDYVKGNLRFIEITYQSMFSELFYFAVPITCTLGMSASYMEDVESGILRYILLRTTKRNYRRSKAVVCALFGGLSMALAVGLVLIVSLFLCPVSPEEMAHASLIDRTYFDYLFWRVFCVCLNGSFYALLGGAVSAFVNNRYMAYASPFIFYYVISTLLDAYLMKQRLFNPREWMMAGMASEPAVIVILVLINVAAGICYMRIMERRWKYG